MFTSYNYKKTFNNYTMTWAKYLFVLFSFVNARPVVENARLNWPAPAMPLNDLFEPGPVKVNTNDLVKVNDIILINVKVNDITLVNDTCDIFYCGSLYTPSTTRVESCICNNHSNTYVYPAGYNELYMSYNKTSNPISQEVYQNNILVGSCPVGLLCNKRIHLEPNYNFMIVILKRALCDDDDDDYNKTDDDTYDLLIYPMEG